MAPSKREMLEAHGFDGAGEVEDHGVVLVPLAVLRMHGVGLWRGEVARQAVALHFAAVDQCRDACALRQGEEGGELRAVGAFLDVESHVVVGQDGRAHQYVFVSVQPSLLHAGNVAFVVEGFVLDAR